MEEKNRILHFIQKVRIRLWWVCLLRLLGRYMLFAAVLGAVLMLYALYVPFYGVEHVVMAIMGFFFVCPILHSIATMKGERKAALVADDKGLKERVITAYEHLSAEDEWSVLQRRDTLRHIYGFPIREKFPVKLSYIRIFSIAGLIIVMVIAGMVSTPAKKQAKMLHDIAEQAEEKQETVEEVKEELQEFADKGELKEDELERLQKILDDSLKEMAEAGNEEELQKAKERMETKLEQELRENDNVELANALDKLSDSMNLAEKAEFASRLEQLAKDNESVENAKDALKDLAAELTEEELEQLAKQLGEMGEAGEITDEDLAAALSSLNQSDAQAIAAAINQSGSASLSSGNTQMAEGNMQGEGGTGKKGEGNGNGNGSGNGSGNGNGTGEGNGGGTGNGSSNGGGYNTGSKKGIEKEIAKKDTQESVTIQKEIGEDENLTGEASGDSKYKVKSKDGLTWAGSRVGYQKVIGEYTQDAYGKIADSKVPESMQDVVKSYFSELNQ